MRGRLIAGSPEISRHWAGKLDDEHGCIEKGADCGQKKAACFVEDQPGCDNGQDEQRGEDGKAAARGIDKDSNKKRIPP